MEEDDLATSFSASSLSSNYQTLMNTSASGRGDSTLLGLNTSSTNNNSNSISMQQQNESGGSPPMSVNGAENGPYALFLFRSNSGVEMYEERRISLDKACKIGRSVAKIRPEPNNAIFDCKVLSRNHALLWQENNKASQKPSF